MKSRCRYTRINGARCTMPALNGHDLCFQHHERKRRAQRKPAPSDPKAPGPLVNLVYMDDHTSVLANLNAIADAFAYGRIDHHQLSALTRLMQTCLKTLHQKKEHSYDERPDNRDPVLEVAYDEDGLPLAADPDPEPQPEPAPMPARGRRTLSEISAGAATATACSAEEPSSCPAPEMTLVEEPDPPYDAEAFEKQLPFFQIIAQELEDNPPVITDFRYSSKINRLFSDTYLPPEGIDPRDIVSLPESLQNLIVEAWNDRNGTPQGLLTPRK